MKIFTVNQTINEENDTKYWKSLLREVLAEFIATFMLLMIGCSAGVALNANPQNKPNLRVDIWAVNICWGFGAFVALAASFNITGGHINPAVSIAMATIGKFEWKKVVPYIVAQMAGAFLGTAIAYTANIDVLDLQHDHYLIKNDTRLMTYGHYLSTGKFFATYPEDHMTLWGSIIDQVVGTASLLFAVCAITDEKNLNIPKAFQPLTLAFVIATHAIAYGYNEGGPLNPARDLGPRIFSSMVVYGKEAFSPLDGNYWWSGGIVGPVVGAVIGVWTYFLFIEYLTPKEKSENDLNCNTEVISHRKLNSLYTINGDIERNNYIKAQTSRTRLKSE